jgi:hypothetical protein
LTKGEFEKRGIVKNSIDLVNVDRNLIVEMLMRLSYEAKSRDLSTAVLIKLCLERLLNIQQIV